MQTKQQKLEQQWELVILDLMDASKKALTNLKIPATLKHGGKQHGRHKTRRSN